MMSKIVVLVDIQNDFVNGSLGSPEAEAIVPKVIEYLKTLNNHDRLLYTYDTHFEDYLETPEGLNLPVEHCIYGSTGWHQPKELSEAIIQACEDNTIYAKSFHKHTFGSDNLVGEIHHFAYVNQNVDEVIFMGLCTDICVISNVLMVKAFCPDLKISVKADCCAGVTPEKHEAALEVMRSCQINII